MTEAISYGPSKIEKAFVFYREECKLTAGTVFPSRIYTDDSRHGFRCSEGATLYRKSCVQKCLYIHSS